MANRRMLSKSISTSKQVNKMSDFAQLLFTWAIAHADDFGYLDGDPEVVMATVIPMKRERSPEDVEMAIQEWVDADLVDWIEVDGDPVVRFKTWDKHQNGLTKKATSKYALSDNASPPLSASEKEIEAHIASQLLSQKMRFDDEGVIDVERQVRIDNSYLDIVARTDLRTFVIEIKRQKLSPSSLRQVVKYREMYKDKYQTTPTAILIGYGVSVTFSMEDAKQEEVSVVTYDDSLRMTLLMGSGIRHLTLDDESINVIDRYTLTELNRTEDNRTEKNNNGMESSLSFDEKVTEVCRLYQSEGFGQGSQIIVQELEEMVKDYDFVWIREAFRISVMQSRRKLSYVDGILSNWKRNGGMKLEHEFSVSSRHSMTDEKPIVPKHNDPDFATVHYIDD